ncbi:uncharacterized protein N7498_009935 [Penicillium cinerascens]|uniref:Uncharacterized protein n=1 Tax=Penicillium cinerascens TaxID=70096 RepID=A0A9W9J9V2_9EURO|nr:uncharacterized protein N7498_009935 [Penicillium cinerascens]KAJ5190950.1 hypothetical protein N7498_009935 [Penicillium cinerascens]
MSKLTLDPADRLRLALLPQLIWQFTESNFPTFVLPNSGFGLLAALAAPILTSRLEPLHPVDLLLRGLQVVLFNWANVFVFDLANQRLPESIVEDHLNKPWRPLPTNQISPETTRRLMLGAIPAALLISAILGVGTESSFILILTWLYNDLHGGDEIIRDLIIALGYGLYLSSSLKIAIGPHHHITEHGYRWIAMMSGIILTTMQVQDLKDQAGDATRGRQTWPLVLGDSVSRWIITCTPVRRRLGGIPRGEKAKRLDGLENLVCVAGGGVFPSLFVHGVTALVVFVLEFGGADASSVDRKLPFKTSGDPATRSCD